MALAAEKLSTVYTAKNLPEKPIASVYSILKKKRKMPACSFRHLISENNKQHEKQAHSMREKGMWRNASLSSSVGAQAKKA